MTRPLRALALFVGLPRQTSMEGGQKHLMPVLVIDHIEPLGTDN